MLYPFNTGNKKKHFKLMLNGATSVVTRCFSKYFFTYFGILLLSKLLKIAFTDLHTYSGPMHFR